MKRTTTRTKTLSALIVLLVLVMISTLTAGLSSGGADTPSSWAVENVELAISYGIVPESLQTRYTDPVTREEFCIMAANTYENATGKLITVRKAFSDTNDVHIQKMGGLEVVNGVGGGLFAPNDKITREQAATILARLLTKMDIPLEEAPADYADFVDQNDISEWAIESVGHMKSMGIMQGTGDNRCSPKDNYTIEQAIVTLLKVYDLGVAAKIAQIVEILDEDTPLGAFPLQDETSELRKFAVKVAELVNVERTNAGLVALVDTAVLDAAATVRAIEQETLFSHTRPDGRDWDTVFEDLGITYGLVGENLAMNFEDPQECVDGWMDSDVHRKNILHEPYRKMGVGIHKGSGGELYWVLLLTD